MNVSRTADSSNNTTYHIKKMKKIIDLCKKNGFVYQGSEIYGGLANSWDYGPLGTVLKENIKNAWLKHFVKRRTDMVQIDSSVILSPKVWKASGHEDSFADPLIECKKCHSRMRFDKLIEAKLEKNPNFKVPNNWAGDKTPLEDINIYLFHNVMDYMSISNYVGLTCQCGSADFSEAQYFNLMLSTRLGAVDDGSDNGKVYLRPETAQGIFINFQSSHG